MTLKIDVYSPSTESVPREHPHKQYLSNVIAYGESRFRASVLAISSIAPGRQGDVVRMLENLRKEVKCILAFVGVAASLSLGIPTSFVIRALANEFVLSGSTDVTFGEDLLQMIARPPPDERYEVVDRYAIDWWHSGREKLGYLDHYNLAICLRAHKGAKVLQKRVQYSGEHQKSNKRLSALLYSNSNVLRSTTDDQDPSPLFDSDKRPHRDPFINASLPRNLCDLIKPVIGESKLLRNPFAGPHIPGELDHFNKFCKPAEGDTERPRDTHVNRPIPGEFDNKPDPGECDASLHPDPYAYVDMPTSDEYKDEHPAPDKVESPGSPASSYAGPLSGEFDDLLEPSEPIHTPCAPVFPYTGPPVPGEFDDLISELEHAHDNAPLDDEFDDLAGNTLHNDNAVPKPNEVDHRIANMSVHDSFSPRPRVFANDGDLDLADQEQDVVRSAATQGGYTPLSNEFDDLDVGSLSSHEYAPKEGEFDDLLDD